MIAILCADGQLKVNDIKTECVKGKWVPILTYSIEGEDGTHVPLFHDDKTARSYIKRNLPKDWVHGGIVLTDEEVQWIKDKGWTIREMSYPNKMCDIPGLKFGLEILEFSSEPGWTVGRL